jgi:hypothetical protein
MTEQQTIQQIKQTLKNQIDTLEIIKDFSECFSNGADNSLTRFEDDEFIKEQSETIEETTSFKEVLKYRKALNDKLEKIEKIIMEIYNM